MGRQDKWTQQEIETLIYQVEFMKLESHQVKIFGRTQRAIEHKMSDLRVQGLLRTEYISPWTPEEDGALFVQIGLERKNISQIKVSGRTSTAVYSRIKVLRKQGFIINPVRLLRPQQIVAHRRKKKVEKRKKLRRKKLRELKKLLDGVARYWPSSVVAEKLCCKSDWVCRWRKRWGMELDHSEAMKDQMYKKNFRGHVERRAESTRKENQRKKDLVKKRSQYVHKLKVGKLEEKFREFYLKRNPCHIVQCIECKNRWYLHKDFFPVIENRKGKTLSDVCAVCLTLRDGK